MTKARYSALVTSVDEIKNPLITLETYGNMPELTFEYNL